MFFILDVNSGSLLACEKDTCRGRSSARSRTKNLTLAQRCRSLATNLALDPCTSPHMQPSSNIACGRAPAPTPASQATTHLSSPSSYSYSMATRTSQVHSEVRRLAVSHVSCVSAGLTSLVPVHMSVCVSMLCLCLCLCVCLCLCLCVCLCLYPCLRLCLCHRHKHRHTHGHRRRHRHALSAPSPAKEMPQWNAAQQLLRFSLSCNVAAHDNACDSDR